MIPILSNLCHFAGSVRKWSGSSLTCVLGWPCLKRIRILYGMCHCTRTVSKIIRILCVILHDLSKNDPDPVWTAALFRICLKMIRILSAILQDVPESDPDPVWSCVILQVSLIKMIRICYKIFILANYDVIVGIFCWLYENVMWGYFFFLEWNCFWQEVSDEKNPKSCLD